MCQRGVTGIIEAVNARMLNLLVAAAVLVVSSSCTSDSEKTAPPAPTSARSSSSSEPDVTAPAISLTKQNAKLRVTIEQLRGGVKRRQWPALQRVIARPIATWIDGAYAGSYPRASYAAAFRGWTPDARRLARRDRQITTNAAVGKRLVALVVDRRVVRLYVFASRGRTGGATAQVSIALTGLKQGGVLHSYAVTGRLYLLRDGGRWRIFGYDLSRREVES